MTAQSADVVAFRGPVVRVCGCGRRADSCVTVGLPELDGRVDVATFWCQPCLTYVHLDRVEAFLRLSGHRPVVSVRAVA